MPNEFKKLKYDVAEVFATFEIKRTLGFTTDLENDIELVEIPFLLENQRQKLLNEGKFWNATEMRMFFISILFLCVDLEVAEKIKLFYERTLNAEIDGHKISVVCDCLLAAPRGIGNPQTPYFFLQEFKKQKNADDAEGQMLLAMLASQTLNTDNDEVYGAFVQGKFWNFTVLKHRDYIVSRSYDASQLDDLQMIFAILKNLKRLVLAKIG